MGIEREWMMTSNLHIGNPFKSGFYGVSVGASRTDFVFNKAVYTTALVAYGWAGAVMQVILLLCVFPHCVTD